MGRTAERVRAIATTYLGALETRLRASRHHTLVDDRLAGDLPTLRFRFVPWHNPFDETAAVPGTVLELLVDGEEGVVARFWIDPVAEEPAEEVRVEPSRFSEAWLHEVVVDFVARTLGRG